MALDLKRVVYVLVDHEEHRVGFGSARSLSRHDRDVPLGVGDRGPVGDVRHGAPGRGAPHRVGLRPALGGDQTDRPAARRLRTARLSSRRSTTSSPGWAFPGVPRSASERGEPPARRQERLALDAGVAAVGQPGARHQRAAARSARSRRSARCSRPRRSDRRRTARTCSAPPLIPPSTFGACPVIVLTRPWQSIATTVLVGAVLDGHEQPVAEPAGLVEGDAVDQPVGASVANVRTPPSG